MERTRSLGRATLCLTAVLIGIGSRAAAGQDLLRPPAAWSISGGYGQTIHWGATHSNVPMIALSPEWNHPLGRHFDYVLGAHIAHSREPDGTIVGVIPLGVLVWPSRDLPYWRMGAGFGWTDLTKLEEIGRRFNFFLQIGLGARWSTRDSDPWTTEIRFLHISNANTAQRNGGLNSLHLLIGRRF